MSTRRELLVVLGAGALAMPLSSLAQPQGKVWRVGILSAAIRPDAGDYRYEVFVAGLHDLGYIEGRNIAFERRFADGKTEPLAALASELVKSNVDVIVTNGNPAVRAVYGATKTIPIVAASFTDPVASGFAASLARPGGNITGLSNLTEEIVFKRLEILVGVVPKVMRIAYLVHPDSTAEMRADLAAAAHKMGKAIVLVEVGTTGDLAEAFSRVVRERAGALLVADGPFFTAQRTRIAELALRHRLSSIFAIGRSVEAGGLMSYGRDANFSYRRAAAFVDKILKGTKPGEIPVEQPTKFELIINMKTATALGITIPPSVMVRATKVIE